MPPNKHAFTAKAVWADYTGDSANLKLKDRITPHVNNVQRKPLVKNISETEARTIKNESRKGASGRWMWMDDVGKGGGGGGGGDVPLIAVLFLVVLSLRCPGARSCKTFPFRRCQNVKIGGSLAQNVRFDAPTCLLLSLWFSSAFAMSMGKAAKLSFSEVSKCQNWRKSRTKCSF